MESPNLAPSPSYVVYEQWKPGTVKYYLYTSRVGEFVRGRRYLAHTDAYGMNHENFTHLTYDQAFKTVADRLLMEDFMTLSYVKDGRSEADGKDRELVIADNSKFVWPEGAPEIIFRYGDMEADCDDFKVVIENCIQ